MRRLFLFFLLGIFTSCALADASFSVGPGRIVTSLDNPQTQLFLVRNTGDELIHIRVTPTFYFLKSKNLQGGKSLLGKKERHLSLVPYVLMSPEAMSLQPGQQQDVRLSIHAPSHLKPGTYRAHILFHMLEIAHRSHSSIKTRNGKSLKTSLNLLMEIATVIYANKGEAKPDLQFACRLKGKSKIAMTVINKTPWHFQGKILNQEETVYRDSKKTILLKKQHLPITVSWSQGNSKKINETICR